MADEDYESDIEIVSDSESETKEVKRNSSKKIIPKTENESEDELEPSDNEEEDQHEIGTITRNPIIPKNEAKEEKAEAKEPAPPKKNYGPPIERVRN